MWSYTVKAGNTELSAAPQWHTPAEALDAGLKHWYDKASDMVLTRVELWKGN